MPTTNNTPPTDANLVDTTGLGYDKLEGIFIRFGPHWKNLTVNKLLDVAYSQNLLDLDDLFSDGSTRTQLKSTVIKRIRKQLIEFVSIHATSTPDKTKIAHIINELFFHTKYTRTVSFPVRTVQELADGLTAALALGHTYMDLFVDKDESSLDILFILFYSSCSFRKSNSSSTHRISGESHALQ